MQTVSLTWQHSSELAGVLALCSAGLRTVPQRRLQFLAPFFFEAAIIGLLYAMWQRAGAFALIGIEGAYRRAHSIQRAEHDLLLPSERSVQHLILGHPWIVQTANIYYATMHFTMMFVFLIWLFVRHRDRYRPVRAIMAWTTLLCLIVQLVPVAPPRLAGAAVDTAHLYNQSVYNSPSFDQLSAMPSVHVAWAATVGFYTVRISTSRWRWIAALHTAITVFVVVSTGNHWWLDGIVAVILLSISAWSRYGIVTGLRAGKRKWDAAVPIPHATAVPARPSARSTSYPADAASTASS